MKFSGRPAPMHFGGLPDEPAPAGPNHADAADTVGFRAIDGSESGFPDTLDFGRALAEVRLSETATDPDPEDAQGSGWPIWLTAAAVACLWALAPIAFAVGYRSGIAPFQNDLFALSVFALLAIGPAAFVFFCAYIIRQGQKLGTETRRARSLTDELVSPALIAAARAGDITQSIREDILRTARAADEARDTLLAMREALAFETEKLTAAAAQSVRTTQELAFTLGRERTEMSGLAQVLDVQATRVTDAIGHQARMVADATGVAETQIRDAESGLSAKAAELVAAAGSVSDVTRVAGEDLTRHIARLETAGHGVAEQVSSVEADLSEHRVSMVALSQSLKFDRDAIAVSTADHAARLEAFIVTTREAAEVFGREASAGSEAVNGLLADAAEQLRELVETARAERLEFAQSTRHALEAVSQAAVEHRLELEAQTRDTLSTLASATEDTRNLTIEQTKQAREQVEQFSEAAFEAGQKANQVFEARLDEARALVEQSSKLVAATGEAATAQLESGVASAGASLTQLSEMLNELELRARRLPDIAREQMEQVRELTIRGMDEVQAHARRSSEEVQDLESALQVRIQENAAILSEVSRSLKSDPEVGSPGEAIAKASAVESSDVAPAEQEAGSSSPVSAITSSSDDIEFADRLGLRNRIRLTPIATDREFTAVFEGARGTAAVSGAESSNADVAEAGEAWTWKDLLASIDDASGGRERLTEALANDLARMNVDPQSLLPTARIEDIAAALHRQDVFSAREAVRALAPAATRRIARRMFTDDDVRSRMSSFVRHYKSVIDEAVARGASVEQLAEQLGSDGGRVFLLVDTAAGDML